MVEPVRLSVVVPARNEASILFQSIEAITAGLDLRSITAEVLIVENGSTDATPAIAAALAAAHPNVRVITTRAADYGTALRTGLIAARAEVAIIFDVDYYNLGFIDVALAAVAGGADIVLACKRGPEAADLRAWHRQLITTTFTVILHRLFRLAASDTHGIKAINLASMRPFVTASRSRRDIYDTELVIRAERAGARIVETPATVVELRPPRLSIVRRGIRTVMDLALLRLRLWQEAAAGPVPQLHGPGTEAGALAADRL